MNSAKTEVVSVKANMPGCLIISDVRDVVIEEPWQVTDDEKTAASMQALFLIIVEMGGSFRKDCIFYIILMQYITVYCRFLSACGFIAILTLFIFLFMNYCITLFFTAKNLNRTFAIL